MKGIKTSIKELLFGEKFLSIECRRINAGYCSHAFIINFLKSKIYVETNIRVRTNSKILFNFNDLWLDKNGNEMTNDSFDKMINIEGSFLSSKLEEVNNGCKNNLIKNVSLKKYGDLIICLENGVVIEIINDTHLENAIIFTIEDFSSAKEITFEIKNLVPRCYMNDI